MKYSGAHWPAGVNLEGDQLRLSPAAPLVDDRCELAVELKFQTPVNRIMPIMEPFYSAHLTHIKLALMGRIVDALELPRRSLPDGLRG